MKNATIFAAALAALTCAAAPIDRAFLKDLVAIPSESAKPERVNEAMAFTRAYLEQRGVPCVIERDGPRDILYASTRPGKVQDYLLCVHLDVVPAPDPKMYEPYIQGDRLYGRGASDDKGNAAVAVQTLVSLLGKASVGVIFTADEEIGGMTTATMVKRGYAARRFALVIDAGAYKVTVAQKGTSYITVRAVGRGGHSSQPWKLDNPIDKLVDAYAKFRAAWPKPTADHWCDIVSATMVSAGEARNRIPDTAEMTVNLRFVSKDGVERVCQALKDAGLEIVNVVTTGVPVSSDPSAPEIQRLLAAMRAKWPEKKPSIDRMLAATDARHFVDMGVPIAIIGAEGGGAHALGEWISLPCLDEYADLLEKFILDAPRHKLPTARELGERYQRTRAEQDRLAWVTALDAEGWDFKQRTRSSIDARGVYKFNRESKVLCVVLRKTDRPGDSWDEDVTPDGRIHFEWTRKPNGGIDYHYSAPTNWDVFVNAYPGMVTRYGAKVMKARIGKGDPMPEVSLPEGWRIVAGEEFSGVNVREAFFTFERDGTNLPPPKVSVNWGTVAIASVHGAKDVSVDGATARFTPTARKPPTGFSTSFPGFGPISSSLSHHLEGMQAGPYKNYPFPTNEVKAVANFVFALREGFRRIGFDRKDAFNGKIWLGGFDSNFPNGHTDFPPHFHLIPSARDGTQVHHFYVDPKDGRVTSDCYQDMSRVMDVWDRVTTFRPGDTFPAYDGHGRVAFRVRLLPDGTGLEVAVEGSPQRFRVAGKRPCDSVDVLLPQEDTWRAVKTVTVRDDPVTGTMETPEGTIHYDPSTGARR